MVQKPFGWSDHAGMFDRRDNHLPWRSVGPTPGQTEHCEVIRLGPATGKNDPVGDRPADGRPEVFTDRFPRFFQDLLGSLAGAVLTGRVGMNLAEATGHRLDDFRPGGRRGVMVQVDQFHR